MAFTTGLAELSKSIPKMRSRGQQVLWLSLLAAVLAAGYVTLAFKSTAERGPLEQILPFLMVMFVVAFLGLALFMLKSTDNEALAAPESFAWNQERPPKSTGKGLTLVQPNEQATQYRLLLLSVADYKDAMVGIRTSLPPANEGFYGARLVLGLYGSYDFAIEFLGSDEQWKQCVEQLARALKYPGLLKDIDDGARPFAGSTRTSPYCHSVKAAYVNKLYGHKMAWSPGTKIGSIGPVALPGGPVPNGVYSFVAIVPVENAGGNARKISDVYETLTRPAPALEAAFGAEFAAQFSAQFYQDMLFELSRSEDLIWMKVVIPRRSYYFLNAFTKHLDLILSALNCQTQFNIITTLGAEVVHIGDRAP